jgi:putative ABC transport system permease protein
MWQWLYTIPLRLRSMFRRSRVESELDEEFRFHLEQRIEYEIPSGRTPDDARYAALPAIEGIEQRKEECRDMRHMNLIDNLVRDVRYSARTLARNPAFTLAVLLALALGIGANTAVFGVVNAVLLRPLPYTDPGRLVILFTSRPHSERGNVSMAEFMDWRARNRSFQTLDVFDENRVTLTGDGETEQIDGMSVTATFFETLKVRPLLGRTFADGEDKPGLEPTVVLSEHLWRRRYASNPTIVGQAVVVNGRPHTVVGVMPRTFEFWQQDVEAWTILPLLPPTRRGPHFLRGLARLSPRVTVEQAAAAMDATAHEVQRANPKDYTDLRFPVVPYREVLVGDIRLLLWVLSGAVLLVLLIAVSNVANLMLARLLARQREIAVRLSIGAGRAQVVRQFMTERFTLSLGGGALGIGLAVSGVQAFWLGPRDLPRLDEIGVDGRVLAFTLLVSLASAMLFGFAPALAACAASLNERLKDGGRSSGFRSHGRVRSALVVAQVSLSVLLVIGAGLLIRSFSLLGSVSPGFEAPPERVLTMSISLTGPRFEKADTVTAFWDQLLERARAIPGVEAASLSVTIPPDRPAFGDDYEIEGKPLLPGSEHAAVPVPIVSHDYRKTLGIPLLRGRWFDSRDRVGTPRVTVISESMARRHFSGENPVGQRIKHGGRMQAHPFMEIIGVVGDVKYQGLSRDHVPVFYQLNSHMPFRNMWLLVRTRSDTQAMAATVRQEIRRLDPGVPIDRVSTMAQALSDSVSLPRFRSLLMTVFAGAALLLAAIGIYGVIAWSIARRTQEIGVRMALGATRGGVLRLVIGQGGRLAVIGIALGLTAAFGLTRVLTNMLFGIGASDTITFTGAALVLGAVAFVASLFPALRAARIDPITALRHE